MKTIFKAIWNLFRNNLVLKITAILFAVILWSYVISVINPTRTRTVDDIAVQYNNTASLSEKGLYISGGLPDIRVTADVAVQQSDVQNLSKQSISAVVDLSTISGPGTYELGIKPSMVGGKVLSTSPSVVTLQVDRYASRTVPVSTSLSGSVAKGYYAYEPVISPSVITVSGAASDVNRVASAVCNINLSGLRQGFNQAMDVDLLDADGNVIDKTLFDNIPSVIVALDVQSMKTVPVDVEASIIDQDNVAAGYEVSSVTCLPVTVDIAGDAQTLSTIDSVRLAPYSVRGKSATESVLLDFEPIEGVTFLSTQKIQVFITIREIIETKTYSNVDILRKNLGSGLRAQISQASIDVTVAAGQSHMSRLSRSDIVPYVDLDGLKAGVYSLKVLFELPEGFSEENFSPSVGTVTVTIY